MDDKTQKDEEVQEEATDVAEAPVEVEEAAPVNVPYQQPELPGTPCPQCKGQGLDTRNQLCANCSGTGRII